MQAFQHKLHEEEIRGKLNTDIQIIWKLEEIQSKL